MPKRRNATQSQGTRDERVRIHLEEISVHTQAIRDLLNHDDPREHEELKLLKQLGRNLRAMYHRHGGTPH